jgi:hypothetical protein
MVLYFEMFVDAKAIIVVEAVGANKINRWYRINNYMFLNTSVKHSYDCLLILDDVIEALYYYSDMTSGCLHIF